MSSISRTLSRKCTPTQTEPGRQFHPLPASIVTWMNGTADSPSTKVRMTPMAAQTQNTLANITTRMMMKTLLVIPPGEGTGGPNEYQRVGPAPMAMQAQNTLPDTTRLTMMTPSVAHPQEGTGSLRQHRRIPDVMWDTTMIRFLFSISSSNFPRSNAQSISLTRRMDAQL